MHGFTDGKGMVVNDPTQRARRAHRGRAWAQRRMVGGVLAGGLLLGTLPGLVRAQMVSTQMPSAQMPAQGRLPLRNLLVEVRQVDEDSARAQGAGLEHGSVSVSSDGRVSGHAEVGWQASTRQRGDAIAQQLRVLNGGRASIRLSQSVPLQWWQAYVSPQGVQSAPTTVFTDAGQGFVVRPSWPGGHEPVTVEVQTELSRTRDPQLTRGGDPDNGIASERFSTLTTLRFPLGEWVTVASSGQSGGGSERGTWSTREVSRSRQIVVQMRITPQ